MFKTTQAAKSWRINALLHRDIRASQNDKIIINNNNKNNNENSNVNLQGESLQ